MGNKLNSKSRKKEISARKKIRRSKRATAPTTPTEARKITSPSAAPTSEILPQKLPNPLKGTVQFLKNSSKRARISLERAERMRQMNERRAIEKAEAQDTLLGVSGDATVPLLIVPADSSTEVTNSLVECTLEDNGQIDQPPPNVTPPKPRQKCRRPAFYRPWSNTKNAVYKRFRRSQQMLNPFMRQIAKIVPIHHETTKPTLNLKTSLKVSADTTTRKYRELAQLKVVVPVRMKDHARRRIFHNSGYVPINDPQKKSTGMWRSLRRTLTELLLVTDFAQVVEPLRVVVSIDGGGKKVKATKVVIHLADSTKPCSAYQCGIYAIILGAETYANVAHVLHELDDEMHVLQRDGLYLKGVSIGLVFFLVCDLKMECCCLGLQGGKATFPCPQCTMSSGFMLDYDGSYVPEERTIEKLLKKAKLFFANFFSLTKSTEPKSRRLHGSISQRPLITAIPVDRIAPPVLHICMGVVNATFETLKDNHFDRAESLLKKAGITVQCGRWSDFTGDDGKDLVNYVCFKMPKEERDDPYHAAFAAVRPLFDLAAIDADYSNTRQVIANVMQKVRKVRHVTTKLHVLECHVATFIDRHKTWGRVSEQGVEAIHKYLNKVVDKMPGKSNLKRLECFLKDHLIRNMR